MITLHKGTLDSTINFYCTRHAEFDALVNKMKRGRAHCLRDLIIGAIDEGRVVKRNDLQRGGPARSVTLTEGMKANFDAAAKRSGMSINECIRTLITNAVEREYIEQKHVLVKKSKR